MLIAFEGQDGAGKTTLLNAVHRQLVADGVDCVVVEEFSASRHGQRLFDAVALDKFLRPVPGDEGTAITRALEIAADLYYLDHHVIGPALSRGTVVLKDRHRDTNIYTLAPTLLATATMPDEATALAWLTSLNAHLDHVADLTVYVDAPLSLRIERIQRRERSLIEDRSHNVTNEDIDVFEQRDKVAKALIAARPDRYLVIDNIDVDIPAAATAIISAARQQHAG